MLLAVHQRLVGVHHLLQVQRTVAVVGEGGLGVVVLVGFDDVLLGHHRGHDGSAENAACEGPAIGYEVDVNVEVALCLCQRLPYLSDVLVLEGLVDAHVVGAPREVGGGAGFLSRSGRAGDGVHADVVLEQVHVGCGQQGQLYGGGEATGVGHMLRIDDVGFVQLRQAVDKTTPHSSLGSAALLCKELLTPHSEVLRQVDDLHLLGNGVLLEEGLALAVSEAEEQDVGLLKWQLVGEAQVSVAGEPFVHVAHQVAGVTLAVGKDNLCLGVAQQQADELTAGIACCAKDSYFYHGLFVFVHVLCMASVLYDDGVAFDGISVVPWSEQIRFFWERKATARCRQGCLHPGRRRTG